jgi:hypothetical protein
MPEPKPPQAPVPQPDWAQWALALLFVGLLAASLADRVWHFDPTPPPDENRAMTPQPAWQWTLRAMAEFPAKFDAWDRENFGLRSSLIHAHAKVMLDGVGNSPSKDVLIGKHGWLYFGIAKSIDAYRCLFPYAPDELAAQVASVRERRDWLAARGIRYLNACAPGKASVYPEFLPDWVHKTGQICRLDQWLSAMRTSGLPVLDLRPAMKLAKADGLAYHRTDSHWNPRGGWFGYAAIARALQPWFPAWRPLDRTQVKFREERRPGGDLARMIDLRERYRGPEVVAELPQTCTRTDLHGWVPPKGVNAKAFACPDSKPAAEGRDLKVVFLHDSYGLAVLPYLAQSAARILSTEFGGFDRALIEREHPDVVIELHVERQLQPDR